MGLDLLARSGIPSGQRAGEALLRVDDALQLVEFVRSEGAAVFGLEAFALQGDRRVPLTDWIADFSDVAVLSGGSQPSCEDAERFLVALKTAGLGHDVRVVVSLTS